MYKNILKLYTLYIDIWVLSNLLILIMLDKWHEIEKILEAKIDRG